MAKINTQQFSRKRLVPVQEPLEGQVPNSTGGHGWEISIWDSLDRFLILGTEGGSFYVAENDLLKQNHDNVIACIKEDGIRAVDRIVEVSVRGLAAKNESSIFALALVVTHGSVAAKEIGLASVYKVCRTGTHLFHFAEYANALRGWGRGLKRAVGSWYTTRSPDQLALQAIKYQQRDGWSHADLLRLSHPKVSNQGQIAVTRWMVGGIDAVKGRDVRRGKAKDAPIQNQPSCLEALPQIIVAFEEAKTADTKRLVQLITENQLPREAIPTEKLKEVAVWDALLTNMPLTAMIRNLGKMTSIGLLKPLSENTKFVVNQLGNQEALRKARVHPMAILVASKIYGQGHGDKGSLTWNPLPQIMTALDEAFYKTFPNVVPCGKPLLIGLDVSGSMETSMAANCLTACEAVSALSLVHANVEPECHVFGFADRFVELGIRKGMSLSEARTQAQRSNFGSTNLSLAIQYAIDNRLNVGGFIVMTDGECNAGHHLAQVLKNYRSQFVEDARAVFVATVPNRFTVNDPKDKYGLDVVGFDASAPPVIAQFIRGNTPAEDSVEVE